MQYFQISEDDLQKVIRKGLELGADYVDIFLEHTASTSVTILPDGENRAAQNIDFGAGVRCIYGDKAGYAYTEQITLESLMKAVGQAALINQSILTGKSRFPYPLDKNQTIPNHIYPISGFPFQANGVEIEEMVNYLKETREKLIAEEDRLVNVSCSIRNRNSYIAISNSVGPTIEECRPLSSINVSAVIHKDGVSESANCSRSHRLPLTMLTPELQASMISELLRKLRFALTAKQPKGGTMPVVMGAGASGILLHEAIGHAFEADFIRRGESIFTDKLNQQICDDSITVVDDGLSPNMRGSIHFDDEGVPSQCTKIVTEGKLTSFLHDRISAKHFGIESTGNGRRESFRSLPIPRMRNTYMLGGNSKEEDIIADVKRGVYVSDFTNGQVQIGAGDYSFFVKAGYLIEDGHLTQPIKDVNIIGNGPQTLADIKAVADNPIIDPSTWICGKDGQGCPVSCGMPSVLVSKLTVG